MTTLQEILGEDAQTQEQTAAAQIRPNEIAEGYKLSVNLRNLLGQIIGQHDTLSVDETPDHALVQWYLAVKDGISGEDGFGSLQQNMNEFTMAEYNEAMDGEYKALETQGLDPEDREFLESAGYIEEGQTFDLPADVPLVVTNDDELREAATAFVEFRERCRQAVVERREDPEAASTGGGEPQVQGTDSAAAQALGSSVAAEPEPESEETGEPQSRSAAIRRVMTEPKFAALAVSEEVNGYTDHIIAEANRRFGPFDDDITPQLVWRVKSDNGTAIEEAARNYEGDLVAEFDLEGGPEEDEPDADMGDLTDEEIDALIARLGQMKSGN